MAMRRLLSFLMMLTISMASGASVPVTLCHHANAQEHAEALRGHSEAAARVAQVEDQIALEKAANHEHGHDASLAMASYLPPQPLLPVPAIPVARDLPLRPENSVIPSGLSPPPLLQPPSA